jgi:hypothetical protein
MAGHSRCPSCAVPVQIYEKEDHRLARMLCLFIITTCQNNVIISSTRTAANLWGMIFRKITSALSSYPPKGVPGNLILIPHGNDEKRLQQS